MIHPTALIGEPPQHRDYRWTAASGCHPIISPTATIEAYVSVDSGIAEPTTIGAFAWLMKHCHVGHDARIGANCELAPGTVIGGHAVLERGVRCGIGVLVKPFVRVGAGARLGMGAVVTKDVPPGEVWAGNPARRLEKGEPRCTCGGVRAPSGVACHRPGCELTAIPGIPIYRGRDPWEGAEAEREGWDEWYAASRVAVPPPPPRLAVHEPGLNPTKRQRRG